MTLDMSSDERDSLCEWLTWFGEPATRLPDVEVCDDGSAWLGLTMIRPRRKEATHANVQ